MANFKKQHVTERRVINNLHVGTTNPVKTYYAYLEIGEKDHPDFYEGIYRTEAIAHFEEQARIHGAKFNGKLYVLK